MIRNVTALNSLSVDASKVDFRNPENFFHDVNSVAGLLKQFFRDMPTPLLTEASYSDMIAAARSYTLSRIPFAVPTVLISPRCR